MKKQEKFAENKKCPLGETTAKQADSGNACGCLSLGERLPPMVWIGQCEVKPDYLTR